MSMSATSDTTFVADMAESPSYLGTDVFDTAEKARCREIAAYLMAASIGTDIHHGLPSLPHLSKDINLNLLVHYGTIRLNADRAFLSLITDEAQFVVAEATRHQSRLSYTETVSESSLFFGVCKLDKCYGICPKTMQAFTTDTHTKAGPNIICDRSRYIINDFRVEPAYMSKPYVIGFPHMVSYVEVPLKSPSGHVLGSYCIVDNVERKFNDDNIIKAITEVSNTIMHYLDIVKTKELRDRSEKLILGLGHLIERDHETSTNASMTASVASTHLENSDVGGSLTATYAGTMHDSAGQYPFEELATPGPEVFNRRLSTYSQLSQASLSASTSTIASEYSGTISAPWTPLRSSSPMDESSLSDSFFPLSKPEDISSSPEILEDQSGPPSGAAALVPPSSATTSASVATHASVVSSDVRDSLSKAAHTIREAMGMDRVIFFDAVPSGFASRLAQPRPHEDPLSMGAAEHFAEETNEVYCATLSQSVKGRDPSQIPASAPIQMPEAMLQRLIRRYPRGHIFTTDEVGPIDGHYAPGHALRTVQRSRKRTTRYREDISKLFLHVPGARYVVLLPLWHFQKEVWFCAMVGYVTDPMFAMSPQDINLLSSFGNSIMAQVSRLEASAVSRAKGDFISSISHELRSPLHGIMASVEMLRDALKDPDCFHMLDMIDASATTLLDTFDNLLDFAKINTAAKSMDPKQTSHLKQSVERELPLVDLSRLVEEVVETVQIGHEAKTGFHAEEERITPLIEDADLSSDMADMLPDTAVLLPLTIPCTFHFKNGFSTLTFHVVMNLLGNSLKYTRSGIIEVGLSMIQKPGSKNPSRTHVQLSVEDTGIGISPNYIKYHLFTPFAQENALSPGTGIGLSIVQQLTKTLGGKLDVKSLIGIGTRIEACFPFKEENAGPAASRLPAIREGAELGARHDLRGLTLCCITWDAYYATCDEKRRLTSEMCERSRATRSILRQIAKSRLGMKIIFGTRETPLPPANVYYLDSYIVEQKIRASTQTEVPESLVFVRPLVMLCSGSGPLRASRDEEQRTKVVHLRQPIAPRKFTTTLLRALEVGKASQPSPTAPPILVTKDVDSYFPGPSGDKTSALSQVEEVTHRASLPTTSSSPSPPLVSTPLALTPVPAPSIQAPSDAAAGSSVAPRAALHLLLVDDNPINLKILTTLVKKLNFTFATARDGLEAVHHFSASLHSSRRLFDVVFMDISMPVLNGFEATREIRKMEKDYNIDSMNGNGDDSQGFGCQIVALTGLGSEESRQDAFSSGIDMFMTKPAKMDKIKRLLGATEERVAERSSRIAGQVPIQAVREESLWSNSNTSSTVTRESVASQAGEGNSG
ncbi:hypothetical protein FKW77_004904 [Venturia effusa]|uniref:histidine kinase n=1 Tax=Venturia effusa TaxID=50376 RepID=A0A517LK59_9PEZI|nr:hypothetical protein FKW77_004904 [Venturia effusa]